MKESVNDAVNNFLVCPVRGVFPFVLVTVA